MYAYVQFINTIYIHTYIIQYDNVIFTYWCRWQITSNLKTMNKYLIEFNKIFELNWFSKFMQFILRLSDGTMLFCLLLWFNRQHSTTLYRGGHKGLRVVLYQFQTIMLVLKFYFTLLIMPRPQIIYFSILHWFWSCHSLEHRGFLEVRPRFEHLLKQNEI